MNGESASQLEHVTFGEFEAFSSDMPFDEKWELLGGRFSRFERGVTVRHKFATQNLVAALLTSFRSRGADKQVYSETFWLKVPFLSLACFPDISVRCERLPRGARSLDDPVVLIEVVNEESAQRDRNEKWQLYTQLPSLRHFALVDCERIGVDVWTRSGDAFQASPRLTSPNDVLRLPAIDFEMPLSEIYRDVIPAAS